MKFKKKPIVIDAIQWTGENKEEILKFTEGKAKITDMGLFISTLEGKHRANFKDWIIKGIKGEFYPCKPDIFEQTYDEFGVSCWKCSGEDIDHNGFCKNCGVNQ